MNNSSPRIIVSRLAGGLGNQMYQYAVGRRLAYTQGVPLKLDTSGYGPEGDTQAPGLEAFRRRVRVFEFNIVAEPATLSEVSSLKDKYENSRTLSRLVRQARRFWPRLMWPSTHFRERHYRFDPEVLGLRAPTYLSGFWQSENYFADVKDIIRRDFTPRDAAIADYTFGYVAKLRQPGTVIVSLHVRRGELAVAQERLKTTKGVFGPPTSTEYIHRAMQHVDPRCKFLVFSDSAPDIAWCRSHIKTGQLHFSEGHNDIQDMMLMTACDQHIIASTFSWWAAWLNPRPGRRVIAPRQWGHPGGVMVTDDLIPRDWVMI